jgi:hypothetical protein
MAAQKMLSDLDMNSRNLLNVLAGVAGTDGANYQQVLDAIAFAVSRANHTGTQTAATVSDFNTAVRTSTLNQMAAPTAALPMNGQRLTGLADPQAAQDAATQAYVLAQVAGVASGLSFKGVARVVVTANVNTAAPGASLDGVALTAGDVVLLTGQTTGTQNGAWVWNGAAAAMTRPANWDTVGEAVPGSLWVVRQGTYDNQLAVLSNDTFTLGTDTATFVFLNPAGGADNDTGYAENCPATAAGVAWPVNHNLGTKDVLVSVRRVASPYDQVEVNITYDTTNQVNVRADVALAAGEFRAVVAKVV